MDRKKIIIMISLLILSVLVIGCNSRQAPDNVTGTDKTVVSRTADENPEDVLVREIADGKLVEIYDEYVRIKPGEIKKNWMIIKNVKDNKEEFQVIPCGGCDFDSRVFEIEAGEYDIIKFKVRAMEGQKEIKVKDHLNNAYGFAKISVIVE